MVLWGEWNYERNITERSGVVHVVKCLVSSFIDSIIILLYICIMLLISIVCSSLFGLMVLNKVAEYYNKKK